MKPMKKFLSLWCLLALLLVASPVRSATSMKTFSVGKGTFLLDGKPFVIKAAELHYPRIPRPYWEQRIKMCKALGMNTICMYVFWNIHEQQQGHFDFTGQNDIAAFVRLCQENGMYVIVRPGPYVCAEWEMGGLPWWLLKKKDIRLRERDPFFMERVKVFEKQVAAQLAPLSNANGGPIIMVQVENEYGSYGVDKQYVGEIRDVLKQDWQNKEGRHPVLFQCDWSSNFEKNGLDDLVWTMNFGTGANIDNQFRRLGELRPDAPKMCSEFWSGWFDKWGARHETRPAREMVANIDEMLSRGISFSLYMTHGGTSFGHWAGANSPGFAPDVTSYDYDAPINEYGQATPKYWELRKMMEKYNDGKKLPAVPKPAAGIITVPKFRLKAAAPITAGVDSIATAAAPLTFEDMDFGWGSMLYTTTLPSLPDGAVLRIDGGHDFVQVFVNRQFVGKMDRVKNEHTVTLPATKKGDTMTILVEAMGRINFGRAIKDFKGIVGDVLVQAAVDGDEVTWNLKNWTMRRIPDTYGNVRKALAAGMGNEPHSDDPGDKAGYYYGSFDLKKVGDTFLNFEQMGKGLVYVNGHALGRIWSIGPQQTLYTPGCWLKKGRNEVVVLDVAGPRADNPVAWGQDKPELNKLQLEKTNKHNNIGDKPDLNSMKPVFEGDTRSGNGWQTLKFDAPAKGRWLAIEIGSNHDGGTVSAIAELYAQDASGRRLGRDNWSTKYADSENEQGNHTGDKAFDLQESTYWQTVSGSAFPHLLVINLGSEQTVSALEYLPRMESGAPGSARHIRVFVY